MRNLGGVPELYDHIRVGVDKIRAVWATKECPGSDAILICKDVPRIELLLQRYLATRTGKLPVEQVIGLYRTVYHILMPFYSLPCEEGV